jgi:predicted helicase
MDIYGSRNSKFMQIANVKLPQLAKNTNQANDLLPHITNDFTKLKPIAPWYLFIPHDEIKEKEYQKGIYLSDIFISKSSGISTSQDDKVIDFKSNKLQEKIKNNFNIYDENVVKNIAYRPFDIRKIYYDTTIKDLIDRSRLNIMQHFLNRENIGLVFMRGFLGTKYFNQISITDQLFDKNFYGFQSYVAPLYLYNNNLGVEEKSVNFKPQFIKLIQDKFGDVKPEVVLGYIYAFLHSPNYRNEYSACLKRYFPKINFDVSLEQFEKLANIGNQLIDAHLMKAIPKINIGEPKLKEGEKIDYICTKIYFNEAENKLYFNNSAYFDGVSKEIFNFKIGGDQVLYKYLNERKNCDISEDLDHIQNIIKVLSITISHMEQIDA